MTTTLTQRQMAARLGVSERTLRRRTAKRGKRLGVPVIRIGRLVRYDEKTVMERLGQ